MFHHSSTEHMINIRMIQKKSENYSRKSKINKNLNKSINHSFPRSIFWGLIPTPCQDNLALGDGNYLQLL